MRGHIPILLRAALAGAVALSPLLAQAQSYNYRIEIPGVAALPPPGETGEPFEVGEYAGPAGFDRNGSASIAGPSVSGGATPYAFALASGSLPPNMSLGAGGSISGNPSTIGTYTPTIRVRDGLGREQLRTVQIQVLNPAGSPLAASFANPAYGATTGVAGTIPAPSASGGQAPYAFSGGTAGATVNPATGEVSFNFGAPGSVTVPVTLRDAQNRTAALSVTIHVADPVAVGSLGGPFYATVGEAGTIGQASASGGRGTLTYSPGPTAGGNLLQVSGTTVSYVAPTAPGTYLQSVRATDEDGRTALSPPVSVVAAHAPSIGLQPAYSDGNAGQPSTIPAASASGGEGPYQVALTSNPGNVLSGSPTTGMTYNQPAGSYGPFTVSVTDARGRQGSRSFTITVPQALAIGAYAASYQGTGNIPGSIPLPAVSGGTAPYAYDLVGAPAGVTKDANGAISYNANPGTYPIAMKVTDAHGRTVTSNTFNLVLGSPYQLTYTQPPQLYANIEAQFTPNVAGGTGPYSYALTAGSVPSGMSFNPSTGVVSGFPGNNVAGSFTVEVTDAGQANAKTSRAVPYTIGTVDDSAIWANVSSITHGGNLGQYQASSAFAKAGLSDSNYTATSGLEGGTYKGYAGVYYANNGASTTNFTVNFTKPQALTGMIVKIFATSQNATTSFPLAVYRNGVKVGNFSVSAQPSPASNLAQSFTIPLSGTFSSLQLTYEPGVTPNGIMTSIAEIDWMQ